MIDDNAIYWLWRAFAGLGLLAISIGARIEPDLGVWVAAFGGSFLSVSIGHDRALRLIFAHVGIGVLIGVFVAQISHWKYSLPQVPVAALAALFGFDLHNYIKGKIVEGKIFEAIGQAISSILGRGEKK